MHTNYAATDTPGHLHQPDSAAVGASIAAGNLASIKPVEWIETPTPGGVADEARVDRQDEFEQLISSIQRDVDECRGAVWPHPILATLSALLANLMKRG